jgi:biopolymer transport protein ExbB/TolQ
MEALLFQYAGYTIFAVKAGVGVLGIYCIVWMLQLLKRRSFGKKSQDREFTDQVCQYLDQGAFDAAHQLSSSPKNWFRAVPMLARYAIENRTMSNSKLQQLVAIRMDSEVMAGMEDSIATVNTCIKTAPMLGLFGTVVGMIGAFGKISGNASPDATKLGGDIALALNATAGGLFVAITLLLLVNFVIVRRRKVEDATVAGIQQILLHLDASVANFHGNGAQRYAAARTVG